MDWNLKDFFSLGVRPLLARVLLRLKSRIFKLILIASAFMVFSYHVYTNVSEYQKGRTVVIVTNTNSTPAQFPPIVACLFPFLNPLGLVHLGLNVSVETFAELEYNVANLIGIDKHITAKKLIEEAAWQFSDSVEVSIGNKILKLHNDRNHMFKTKQPYFMPFGPCSMFIPPADASLQSLNLSIKLRRKPIIRYNCSWVHEMCPGEYSRFHCDSLQNLCNSSLVWDQYTNEAFYMLLLFMTSTYNSYDLHTSVSDLRIYSGRYSYELLPFEISSDLPQDGDYNPRDCLLKVYLESLKSKPKCNLMNTNNILEHPINNLCVTDNQIIDPFVKYMEFKYDTTNNQYACQPKQNELRWRLKKEPLYTENDSGYVNLTLLSSTVTQLHKILAYPLNKLLSDIGGSLGLFLGISFLDLWLMVGKLLLLFMKRLYHTIGESTTNAGEKHQHMKHVNTLCTFSGMIVFGLPFCIHFGINIVSFIHTPFVTSVRMSYNYFDENLPSVGNLTLEAALFVLQANRPLGCQLLSLSDSQKCFLNCFLKDSSVLGINSFYVNDLPLCQYHTTMPKMKYIQQSGVMHSFLYDSNSERCENKCKLNQLTDFKSSVLVSVNQELNLTLMDKFCSLGGITGLYFGFSLFLLGQKILGKQHRIELYEGRVKFLWKSIMVLICMLLCLNPLEKYTLNHPIYSESATDVLTEAQYPRLTACIWPPFDIRKLVKLAGIEDLYNEVKNLDSQEKRDAIASLINDLGTKNASGKLNPHFLWHGSAWSMNDFVVRSINATLLKNSLFNVCIHENEYYFSTPEPITYLNLASKTFPLENNSAMNILMFIQNKNDFPPITKDFTGKTATRSMKLIEMEEWGGLYGKDIMPEECSVKCLDEALAKSFECNLPWMDRHEILHPCNMTQFARFLMILWTINPDMSSMYRKLLNFEAISNCQATCQPTRQSFYKITVGDMEDAMIGPGFSLYLQPAYISESRKGYVPALEIVTSTCKKVSEIDLYPLAQLISDIGGIIGITLGLSLLSLLFGMAEFKKLIKK